MSRGDSSVWTCVAGPSAAARSVKPGQSSPERSHHALTRDRLGSIAAFDRRARAAHREDEGDTTAVPRSGLWASYARRCTMRDEVAKLPCGRGLIEGIRSRTVASP